MLCLRHVVAQAYMMLTPKNKYAYMYSWYISMCFVIAAYTRALFPEVIELKLVLHVWKLAILDQDNLHSPIVICLWITMGRTRKRLMPC